MANAEDLQNRFMYHAPKEGQPEVYESIRSTGLSLARLIATCTPVS